MDLRESSNNKYLRMCLSTQRNKIIAALVFSFILNILMLTVPLYLLQIINRVIPSQSADTLLFLTIIVVAALTTIAFLESMRRLVFSHIGTWIDRRLGGFVLSGSIIKSVDKCKPSSSQALRELSTLRRLFSDGSFFPLLDIPWTPIFMLVLFMLHPIIGIISLAGAIALFCLALFNEYSTRNLTTQTDKASSESYRYAASVLRNSDVIQAMGMRSDVIGTWDRYHDKSVELKTKLNTRSNKIASFAKFIRMILQISVIGAGALLVLKGQLTTGGLIAGMLLMRRAVAPMDRAIITWKTFITARNAFDTIESRLALAPEFRSQQTLPLPQGYMSIRNVSYSYPNHSGATLHDVTLKVHPGQVVGITGNTAAGKSTLSRLIVGLAKPDSGYVRLGGTDISKFKAEELGPLIGYLPQDNELFSGTVESNIARMGEVDKMAVIEAAKLAGVHEMIMQFPEGYETDIGDGGAYLSGGQKQRIALARAIFRSPKLLVLDEPDANLDSDGKTALFHVIKEMKERDSIIIFISHQSKVLEFADTVVRMRKGKIIMSVTDNTKSNQRKTIPRLTSTSLTRVKDQ